MVTAVDLIGGESGYATEDNATPDATPAAPTGLVATAGDYEVSLAWDDNAEGDIAGYNVYRSLTSGSGYAKINGSLVVISDFTDTGVTNDVTYYYVVTAVDLISNESANSSEDSATPTGLTLLSDGFEGDPWDGNWDGNGATTWTQRTNQFNSGLYSARGRFNAPGDLTSDDLNASSAVINIYVEFWFRPKNIEAGDVVIEIYNGSTWDTLFDLSNGTNNAWNFYSSNITGSQYFISNFKIRFNGSTLAVDDVMFIDDILIKTNQ